jgi:uncharacterized protein YndB with AHSA1/START domain
MPFMPDIKHLITIDRPAADVFPLVSSGHGFAQWWAEDVFDDTGSRLCLGFFSRATVYRLRQTTAIAPTTVIWECETGKEWRGTRIVFDLSRTFTTTSLAFSHEAWLDETDYFRSCNTTWGELLFRLKAAAEGKNPGPLFGTKNLAY